MKRGRGQVVTGIVLVLGSVVAFVAGIVMMIGGAVSGANGIARSETFSLPAQNQTMSLQKDVYVIYVLQAAGTGARVTAGDVTVTSSAGSSITVTPKTSETYHGSGGAFGSVAEFTTPAAGTYSVSVNGPVGSVATVYKGASAVLGGVVGGGALVVGSIVGFVLGVVLLIVGLVRGRRRPPAGGAPAQAYRAPGYPPQPAPYPPQGSGYPAPSPGYPPQQPSYPPSPGYPGYPPPQGEGYPPQ